MLTTLSILRKPEVTILFIVICSALVSCDSISNYTEAEYVARAKDAQDIGNFQASVIELKNALQKNPDNPETRRLLGIANTKLGNGASAEKELRKSLALGVAREAVLPYLAEALQLQGKHQQILDEIDAPQSLDPPNQAKLLTYRGNAWLALGKSDKSQAEYERALEIDNGSALAKLGMARLAARNNEQEKAFRLLDEALETSPDDGRIWSYQARLFKRVGFLEKAEASFGKSIELLQNNHIDKANRAVVRVELQNFEGAQKDIQFLKKEAPKFYLTYFAEGLLAFNQKNYKKAEAVLEKAHSLNSNFPDTRFYLGASQLHNGHIQQAQQNLQDYLRVKPQSIGARQILATAKFRLGEFSGAKIVLLPVIKSQPDDAFSLDLMGKIEFALGNKEQGIKYLQKAVMRAPESPTSHARLGLSELIHGDTATGLQELQTAVKLNPELENAQVLIAATYLRKNELDKAERAIHDLRKKHPESPTPLNLLGLFYLAKENRDKARAAFEQAIALSPGHPGSSHNLAKVAFREKKYDDTRKLYLQVLDKHPKHLKTRMELAKLDAFEGNSKAMEEQLKKAIEDHPNALQPRLVIGHHYLRFGQPQRTQTILEELRIDKKDPRLLLLLTQAQLAEKKSWRALQTAKLLAETTPNSALAQYILSKAYAANGKTKNVRLALDRSLEIDPTFFLSRLAKVKILTLEKKNKEAENHLNELLDEYPENTEVLVLEGWFAMQHGQARAAADAYQKALGKQPSSFIVTQLAKSLWAAGDKENSVKTLKDWNDKHRDDVAVRLMRSTLYATLGLEKKARKQLMRVLAINPNNVLALNNLAWMLQKKDPKKALEYVEKALDLAPKLVTARDTLAMILLEQSENERALGIMEKLMEEVPHDDLLLRYHLALAQEKNGRKKDAIKNLKKILAQGQEFKDKKEAESLLKKLEHN